VVPLLLCCLEAALLAPGLCKDIPAHLLEAMSCFAIGINTAVAVILAATDGNDNFPADVAVQVTEQFAGPMLLLLLAPAVRQSLRLAVGKQQQEQQQQEAFGNMLSGKALECQADIRHRTSELWSILVHWVAFAAGVYCQSGLIKYHVCHSSRHATVCTHAGAAHAYSGRTTFVST
jgi:hypothetical protein